MKLKRLLTLVLTVLAVCCFSVACGSKKDGNTVKRDDQGLIYTLSEEKDYYIVSSGSLKEQEDENGEKYLDIYIPEEFAGKPVKEIKASAFKGKNKITYVEIPDSIEVIGEDAFTGLNDNIFKKENGANYLGNEANPFMILVSFQSEATDFTVNASTKFIHSGAFSGNETLTTVTLPNGLISIGTKAFNGCTALSEATLSNGLTEIAESTFANTGLTKINIPNGVTTIAASAFKNSKALADVTLPDSITSVAKDAFDGCNVNYTVENGVSYLGNETNKYHLLVSADKTIETCAIKEGTKIILTEAFKDCAQLKSLTLPAGIYSIEDSAFANCQSLESVVIPANLAVLGNNLFSDCKFLYEVEIKEQNEDLILGTNLFENCIRLCEVWDESEILPVKEFPTLIDYDGQIQNENGFITFSCKFNEEDNVYEEKHLINYVGDATEIIVPDGITHISDNAFNFSSEAVEAYDKLISAKKAYDEKNTTTNKKTYEECLKNAKNFNTSNVGISKITKITLSDSVIEIGDSAFTGLPALTTAEIGNGVEIIGENAFSACEALTTVNMGEGVKTIEDSAFSGCKALNNLKLGVNVETIGELAFYGCYSLTKLVIEENVKKIEDSAFYNCVRLVAVQNKSKLSIKADSDRNGYVGYYAINVYKNDDDSGNFSTDENGFTVYNLGEDYSYLVNYVGELAEITLPDNVTNVNQYAFYMNETVTDVIVPNTVYTIGKEAFYGSKNLKSLNLPYVGASSDAKGETALFGYIFGYTSFGGSDAVEQYYSTSKNSKTTFYIPSTLESVTLNSTIPYGAFYNCKKIKSITLNAGVTEIGENAFYGCSGLKSINYNYNAETDKTIFTNLSEYDQNLISNPETAWTQIKFANSYSNPLRFGGSLYLNGSEEALTKANLKFDVNAFAFYNYALLENVTLNTNSINFGESAFEYCYALVDVYYNSVTDENGQKYGIETWAEKRFANYASNPFAYAKNLYVDGVLTVNYVLTIPKIQHSSISKYAFYKCNWLAEVIIPATITEIEEFAFAHCNNIVFVHIGENVDSIGEQAFYNNFKLALVYNDSSLNITAGSRNNGYVGYYAEEVA